MNESRSGLTVGDWAASVPRARIESVRGAAVVSGPDWGADTRASVRVVPFLTAKVGEHCPRCHSRRHLCVCGPYVADPARDVDDPKWAILRAAFGETAGVRKGMPGRYGPSPLDALIPIVREHLRVAREEEHEALRDPFFVGDVPRDLPSSSDVPRTIGKRIVRGSSVRVSFGDGRVVEAGNDASAWAEAVAAHLAEDVRRAARGGDDETDADLRDRMLASLPRPDRGDARVSGAEGRRPVGPSPVVRVPLQTVYIDVPPTPPAPPSSRDVRPVFMGIPDAMVEVTGLFDSTSVVRVGAPGGVREYGPSALVVYLDGRKVRDASAADTAGYVRVGLGGCDGRTGVVRVFVRTGDCEVPETLPHPSQAPLRKRDPFAEAFERARDAIAGVVP